MKIQQLEPGASVVEVELGPNDVLVLTCEQILRPEQREQVYERVWSTLHEPWSCLILDGGIRASVLKRSAGPLREVTHRA